MPLRAQKPDGKVTVLLADDNSDVRESLCRLLELDGRAEVVGQARNGREAVKMAMSLQPNVILMDIAMPVLNGFDAMDQILATNHAAKVLMLSSYADDEYVERAIALGAVGFLGKLTVSEKLADAICEVAKGKRFFSSVKRMR
jgi:DNA-binding NarL/FixJ family response regulator